MRVLYLGANLRMQLSTPAAPEIRGLGLMQGLEQAGVEVIPLMAGDQLNAENKRSFYSKWLKHFLPHAVAATLRDVYEIILDEKLFRIVEPLVQEISPEIILQKHSRYGQVGVKLSQKYNIPIYLDDITPIWEGEIYDDRSLKPIARQIRKKVFSQASGLIAVSPEMKIQLRSEGIPDHKIHFVPNGVDCILFDPDAASNWVRQEYGLSDKIVVGYVGIFATYHKLDLLFRGACRIAKSVSNIHFLLVGDCRDGKLMDLAHEHGVADRFTFTGRVPHEQVPSYLNAMDFCVVPGTLQYMSPMKIYEYMAMRKPVIAATGNSILEAMVIPHKNGLLFEDGSESSLADAIITLAANPEMVRELGAEARRFVESNFTWYHQTRNLHRAFEVVLKNPGPSNAI